MKNIMLLLLTGAVVVSLMGCETTRGAGKDIENTGQNIQDTVEKND